MSSQNNVNNLNKDSSWVRQSFLVQVKDLQTVDQENRTFTPVSFSFTDTAPGGSLCINPPPQFTRYADLKPRSAFGADTGKNRAGNVGIGRYYGEAIEAHSQVINIRCGVPSFNSLTTFFSGFYNTSAGTLARTGRAPSAFYELGRAAGFVVSILSWKLLAVTLLGNAARFFLQKPSSKFYYSKPAMPLYWNAVQTIVNQIAVNMGVVPRIGGTSLAQTLTNGYQFDANAQTQLHQLLPDIINPGGSIDVYAMANRAQRLNSLHHANLEQSYNSDNLNLTQAIQQAYTKQLTDNGGGGWTGYLQKWLGSSQSKTQGSGSDGSSSTTESLNNDASGTQQPAQAYDSGFFDFLGAELNDGSAFVSFRVNATGQVGESFSNSFQESEIKQKINGISSQARSAEFDLANGNILGGVAGQTLGAAIGAVGDLVKGALDSVSLSGLAALGGSAFVDIPRNWQDSVAQLPRMNYTINLVSPYGNRVSQLLNLYVPLAMLLAMSLPIATGKQSYTSPFLCEVFDRGRCQSRLAMVESLSISRGTGNTGWNKEGHAMGIEVSISFADMSTVLAMPISQGFTGNAASTGAEIGGIGGAVIGAAGGPVTAAGGAAVGAAALGTAGAVLDAASNAAATIGSIFDDDNTFTDYMAVLSGMGLTDQIYSMNKFKLNLTRAMTTWKTWYSTAHFASFMGDTLPGHVVSAIFRGTVRQ
ncbi:hypothetical protein [Burkholderia phage FLC9]|nr:hypothetical protein [Burkholderia phage FLC9]